MELRIKLDEPGFRALCRGGEVTVKTRDGHVVKMILADIGFGPMADAVDDSIAGKDHYKPVVTDDYGKEIQ